MLESGYIRQWYLNLDKHTDIVFDIRRSIGFITQCLELLVDDRDWLSKADGSD